MFFFDKTCYRDDVAHGQKSLTKPEVLEPRTSWSKWVGDLVSFTFSFHPSDFCWRDAPACNQMRELSILFNLNLIRQERVKDTLQ